MTPTPSGAISRFRVAARWLLFLPLRVWRRTWRYLAVLVGLLIIAHIAFNVYVSRQLERELALLRAQGAPLTMTEAAPPKIPDSENAAVLYLKAFKALDSESWVIREALRQKPMRLRGRTIPPPTAAQLEALVVRHEADFLLLRDGSLRAGCRFPVKWEAGFAATYKHLASARGALRFLLVKARVDARRGRAGDALDDLAVAVRLSDHVGAEPTLISQLVRIAMIAIVCNALPDVLAAAPPNEGEARAFYDLVSRVDLVSPYVRTLEGSERALGLSAYEYWRGGRVEELTALMTGSASSGRGGHGWRQVLSETLAPIGRALGAPVLKLDEAYYLRQMRSVITLAREPYRQSRAKLNELATKRPWYASLAGTVTPVFVRAAAAREKAAACLGLMQAALALRDYQTNRGAYPASLAELGAAGGWAIPDDPFTGKPFVYRREGQGYIIYSIGSDFKDDGGLDRRAMYEKLRAQKRPYADAYDIPLQVTR